MSCFDFDIRDNFFIVDQPYMENFPRCRNTPIQFLLPFPLFGYYSFLNMCKSNINLNELLKLKKLKSPLPSHYVHIGEYELSHSLHNRHRTRYYARVVSACGSIFNGFIGMCNGFL